MRCPDVAFNAPSEVPPPSIYGDEPLKPMKLPIDFSSITQSSFFFPLLCFLPLSHIYRPTEVEKLWREAFKSLYNYLSRMDIVCLKMTFVFNY